MDKPRRQEQEPAEDVIGEPASGVLRLQLPITLPGLGHVNCYALEDERGFALVDPGLPGAGAWRDLTGRLAAAGIPLARVHTVVVTHSHFDHFGAAAHLRHETGAEIVTHRAFHTWWDSGEVGELTADDLDEGPGERDESDDVPPWERPTPWGGQPRQPPRLGDDAIAAMLRREAHVTPVPSRRLDDADVITLARRDWVAVHTPGHTPDHLCLFDPAEGVLLCGDHVLPTITPHISGLGTVADPLAQFFASLDRMAELTGVTLALPAHGHPFTDLPGRAKAIRRHHEERLEMLRTASEEIDGPATVEELSHHLFSPRSWGSMAESETYAHLEHLRLAGQARRGDQDGVATYVVTP